MKYYYVNYVIFDLNVNNKSISVGACRIEMPKDYFDFKNFFRSLKEELGIQKMNLIIRNFIEISKEESLSYDEFGSLIMSDMDSEEK
jgi:hypothetical protein